MRKSITLIIILVILGLNSSQGRALFRDPSSKDLTIVKKHKIAFKKQIAVSDTIVDTGKFKIYKSSAHASYYHDKFNGRKTASGSRFDNTKLTAAHKKLPFGTKVKVTNEANGKSIIVVITDRGPFVKSREIDLSKRAFKDIASRRDDGAMQVTIALVLD